MENTKPFQDSSESNDLYLTSFGVRFAAHLIDVGFLFFLMAMI